MAKSTSNRDRSKSGSQSGGKGGSRGKAGAPSKTGEPSGKYRDNAPRKGKSK